MRAYRCRREHFCDKDFAFESAREVHEKLHDTHKLVCAQCLGRYKSAANLMSHMALHEGRPNVVCTVCGDEFAHAQKLRAHRKREPPGHRSKRCVGGHPSLRPGSMYKALCESMPRL